MMNTQLRLIGGYFKISTKKGWIGDMIIYCKESYERKGKVLTAVKEVYPKVSFSSHHSLEDIFSFPIWSNYTTELFLFLVGDISEITELVQYQSYLKQCKSVLVLPNKSSDYLSMSCLLQPTYIADINGDLTDLKAVINKVINKDP